jgi:hypothetical protein
MGGQASEGAVILQVVSKLSRGVGLALGALSFGRQFGW